MSKIHIAQNHESLGAFFQEDVRQGILSGRFKAGDLAWREGMSEWRPLGEMAPQWEMEIPPPSLLPADGEGEQSSRSLPRIQEEGSEPAWEDRGSIGYVPAILHTLKAVLFRPTATFSSLKHTGGLMSPLLYTLLLNTTLHTLFGLLSLAGLMMMSSQEFESKIQLLQVQLHAFQELSPNFIFSMPSISKKFIEYMLLGNILLWPAFAVAANFLGAGILHLSLRMVGGANRPFETTFRAICYLCGSFNAVAIVLDLIPGIGAAGILLLSLATLVYLGWYSYVSVVAIQQAQSIGVWKVLLASLVFSFLGLFVLVGLSIMLSPLIAGVMKLAGFSMGA